MEKRQIYVTSKETITVGTTDKWFAIVDTNFWFDNKNLAPYFLKNAYIVCSFTFYYGDDGAFTIEDLKREFNKLAEAKVTIAACVEFEDAMKIFKSYIAGKSEAYFDYIKADNLVIPTKPPLGLKARFLVEEERLEEIQAAISRYMTQNKKIPTEWLDEYNERCLLLQNLRNKKNE